MVVKLITRCLKKVLRPFCHIKDIDLVITIIRAVAYLESKPA